MAKRVRVRIDMTPMVDVAFLLLIFFMSTTQFKPPESVAVQLPASTSEIRVPETSTIILTVNEAGQVFLSTELVHDTVEVPPEAVVQAVMEWRSRYPSSVVILKGDRNADFGAVSDVIDALAEAKTLRFNLMTDLKREARPEAGEGNG